MVFHKHKKLTKAVLKILSEVEILLKNFCCNYEGANLITMFIGSTNAIITSITECPY